MARTIDTQTRKTGDTLRLSGELTGDTMPTDDADWVGATAEINIVLASDLSAYRTSDPVTLDAVTAPRRYLYEGDPPDAGDIGSYLYEIEVTFADTTITTFPNSDDRCKLKIVAELG
jgi:hypothetical protein